MAGGDGRGLATVFGAELAQDVGDVELDGAGADVETVGDLGVGEPLAEQAEHFPLAPGEVYRPAYNASREYFTRVNVTNTIVNVTNVVNVYNNPRTEVRYVNVNDVNAVTAVPAQAFVQSKPVHRSAVRVATSSFASK